MTQKIWVNRQSHMEISQNMNVLKYEQKSIHVGFTYKKNKT